MGRPLEALLARLEAEPLKGPPEAAELHAELLALGPEALGAEPGLPGRLGRRLGLFSEAEQRELVATLAPLRANLHAHLSRVVDELRSCLEGDNGDAPWQRATKFLRDLDAAPQLRCYKQCGAAEQRVEFLLLLATAIRAVGEGLPGAGAEQLEVRDLLLRLTARYFVVPKHGDVLGVWLDARLHQYNLVWRLAANRAVERCKEPLQARLTAALRSAECPPKDREGWLELARWPMVRCPLARAFRDFAAEFRPSLGDLGPPDLKECPSHTLRPETLLHLLRLLPGAFEVGGSAGSRGMVRLLSEARPAAGAPSEPAAESVPPADAAGAPAAGSSAQPPAAALPGGATAPAPAVQASSSDADQQQAAAPAAPAAQQGGAAPFRGVSVAQKPRATAAAEAGAAARVAATRPVDLGFEAPAQKVRTPRAPSAGASPGAVAGEAGGDKGHAPQDGQPQPPGDAEPRLVRKTIDWQDVQLLEQMVRRGLPVDEEWRAAWQQHCEQKRAPHDFSVPPGKDVVTEFVERHLFELLGKAWARDLMYLTDGPAAGPAAEASAEAGAASSAGPGSQALALLSIADGAAAVQEASVLGPGVVPLELVPFDFAAGGATSSRSRDRGSDRSSSSRDSASSPSRRRQKKGKKRKESKARLSMIGFSNEEASSDDARDMALLPSIYHKTRLCFGFLEGKCSRGRDCNFAHSQAELKQPNEARKEVQERLERRFRKDEKTKKRKVEADAAPRDPFFKTQLCPYWMQGQCANGMLCYFAHSQDEVRTTPEATAMMSRMLGMPMMMGGRPPGPDALAMGPMALMAPPMVQHALPMLGAPGSGGGGAERKGRRKDGKEKEGKAKKKKDRDRDGEDKRDEGKEKSRNKEKDKDKDKEKEKEKEKEKKEKKAKGAAEKKEKKRKAASEDEGEEEARRESLKDGKKDKVHDKERTKKHKKEAKAG